MDLQKIYEEFYQSEAHRPEEELSREALHYGQGLVHFAQDAKGRFYSPVSWGDISLLETGSGLGGVGLGLSRLGARVSLVDFSPSALTQAEKIFYQEGQKVRTIVGDVTKPDLLFDEKYDLIVDSHLLHCLTQKPDRSSYYRLMSDHLKENGIFIAETMVYRKNIFIPDGFMLDQNKVLWQMLGEWIPVRVILDSLDLETELLAAGFEILYFYYYGQSSFVPHRSFLEIPAEILPATVRFVVKVR